LITNEAICTFTPHSTDTLEADTVKNKLSRVKKNDDFDEKDFSRNFLTILKVLTTLNKEKHYTIKEIHNQANTLQHLCHANNFTI